MKRSKIMPVILLLMLMTLFAGAGTVGKISGWVSDAATTEPLINANVIIKSLEIGTSADVDGSYFILNVPPGIYEIEASMLGYQSEIMKGVQVYADRTTFLDFDLTETVLWIEPVTAVATRPVIEIAMTSKETRVTGSELDLMPVEKLSEAIIIQGGVTTDASGDIHVRGGRSGEVAYYIDGIEASNPLLGNAPLLSKNLVSEMSLLSGTFNAEYGNVMSGVVNVVTPEGQSKFSSQIEYTSLMVNSSPYRKKDWMSGGIPPAYDSHRDSADNSLYSPPNVMDANDLPFLGEVSGHMEGPLFFDKSTRFFVGGNYSNQNSVLPFGYELVRTINGKITKKLGPYLKLFADLQYAENESQGYSHVYKYIPENYLVSDNSDSRVLTGINHAPGKNFYYNLRFGYMRSTINIKVPDLPDSVIEEPVYDNYSEFYISGYPIFRQTVETKKYVAKADFNLLTRSIHNFKFGLENNIYSFAQNNRQQLFTRGPIVYQDYTKQPVAGAVFIQDNIEHRYMILNLGLRFDYNYPNAVMWEDVENPNSETTEVKPSYQLSPRFGLSHPITDQAMLHFAYGHFFQNPPYEIMYFNNNYVLHPESIPRYGLVGNPRILPERTTTYEVGVKYAIAEIYGLDLTLFLKDIKDLLSTTEVRLFPYDYIVYTNEDFGSVQGFDLTITRQLISRFGFDINYTYQVARGNRSFAMQGFYDVYTGLPERMEEYYLDFDRRHTLATNVDLLFNDLGGFVANFRLASGLPYTPYISEGLVVEANSGRMAWEYSLDLMIHQGVRTGFGTVTLFAKGLNLTDHINPRYVYSRTGDPWDSGEESGGLMGSRDYVVDPANVGQRRTIKAGLRIAI
ncbi:MAG TPA: TonB-dependent receptor [bacterium]